MPYVRYRLLQPQEKSSPYARGIAYERDGKILYFAPAYRGSAQLSVSALEDLRDREYPAAANERWMPIEIWDETKEIFMPHVAIEKPTRLEMRDIQDLKVVDTGRRRTNLVALLAALCSIGLIAGVLWLFYKISRTPPAPDMPVFARDIFVFLDTTESPNHAGNAQWFQDAKDLIVRKILPDIGPGDRIFCYTIATDFVESRNRIFLGVMPQVPESLVAEHPSIPGTVAPEEIAKLWEPVERALSPTGDGWPLKVGAVRQQKGGFSDYIGAFSYVVDRLESVERGSATENYLIVLGDLRHEPVPVPFEPPDPTEQDKLVFKGIHIKLITPFIDATVRNPKQPSRQKVQTFWSTYFADRGNHGVEFLHLDTPDPPLPPSRVRRPPHNLIAAQKNSEL
jgi:hypothetical protein